MEDSDRINALVESILHELKDVRKVNGEGPARMRAIAYLLSAVQFFESVDGKKKAGAILLETLVQIEGETMPSA